MCLATTAWPPIASAETGTLDLPADLQSVLIVKLLDYHANQRVPSSNAKLLLVHQRNAVTSRHACHQIARALAPARTKEGSRISVRVWSIDRHTPIASIRERLAEVQAVFGCAGLIDRAQLIDESLRLQVLSITLGQNGVEEGFMVGFDVHANRPRLYVNLPALRLGHIHLDARVLALAQHVTPRPRRVLMLPARERGEPAADPLGAAP